MKPVKIVMTAFGPYKSQEVVDFAELGEHRLFVVSGNTGAGKTTIFDAICFALYGEASGEERSDTSLLRSHFADDDTHTSVELTFEIHGQEYRVFRQLPHVKEGNKTATGAQYELYVLKNDEAIPAVDRFNVTDINQKIEAILGLTKDQFSQIVMLPQGEFRKLLTSETENKEEILRRIFKTGVYQRFAERLKEKKQTGAEQYKQLAREREVYIGQIQGALPEREGSPVYQVLAQEHYNTPQLIEALEEEALYYRKATGEHKEEYEKAAERHKEKTAAFHRAEALKNKFQTFDEKKVRKAELDSKKPEMLKLEEKLEQAEKAGRVEPYESYKKEAEQELSEKKQQNESAQVAEKTALEALSQAKSAYAKEEAVGERREALGREVDRLESYLTVVSELAEKEEQLKALKEAGQKKATDVTRLERELEQARQEKQYLSAGIRKLEERQEGYQAKLKRLSELREQTKILQDYFRVQAKLDEAEKSFVETSRVYQDVNERYEKLEKLWLEGQAGLLAAHLQDGEACPVCGSTEHPRKAETQAHLPSKEELDLLRKERVDKQQAFMRARTDRDSLVKQLEAMRDEDAFLQGDSLREQYERWMVEGKALRQETDQLEKERAELKQQKATSEQLDQKLESKRNQLDSAKSAMQDHEKEYEKQEALFVHACEQIPEAMRSLGELKRHLNETVQQKKVLEARWEAVQKDLQKAEKEAAVAETNAVSASKQHEDAAVKVETAKTRFLEQLEAGGFPSEQAYREAKIPEDERPLLKQRMDDFQKEWTLLERQIEDLELELKPFSRPDLEVLQAELDQFAQNLDEARDALQLTERLEKEAVQLKERIAAASTKVDEAERSLQMITDLYDTVRGDNPRKISFERYMQIEFLEQIVHAANLRLRRLSNGQFYLMRSDRLEKRGRQSGLGLDVYDAYTGQTRDVKTLSGGEKFNASLCLALGMADVIQAFEGGISIETMFIDEGFGSLDEESLNKAIDTLIDLQKSGRMVGVISHVQELKNAIPAVLEVKKTKEGYSHTTFLLK